jgi:HEAT repeat protein
MFGLSPLPRTLRAALSDIRHKKLDVRMSAVRDLGRLADPDRAPSAEARRAAVAALETALIEDETAAVRSEAAIALADAGAHAAVSSLVRAANDDEHVRVRQMAIVALGELANSRDEGAYDVVSRTLESSTPELRFQALIAFSHMGKDGAEADTAVLACTRDADPHIRYVAFRLAEERWIGDESRAPDELLVRAREALEDEAGAVRLAAAILLGRTADASGASELLSAVESGRGAHEPEDLAAAIELCGELGLDAARAGLERRAFGLFGVYSDSFAWQARVSLARLGDARARRVIIRGLAAWSRDTRTMAVAAAGRARLAEAKKMIEDMRGKPDRAEPEAVAEALDLLGGSAL